MKIGVLGHLLLGLLTAGERTGYELTGDFDTTLANVWAASHSQIYPELAKLEAASLIRKTAVGPRGSQRYAITETGRTAVAAWLAETTPGDAPRSERIARVFFLGMLQRETAAHYLAMQEKQHRATLARYNAFAEACPLEGEWRFHRIALEAGIRAETALADWAAWAITALGED